MNMGISKCCMTSIYTWVQYLPLRCIIADIINCLYAANYPTWCQHTGVGRNGRHIADDILNPILLHRKIIFFIDISLQFITMGPIDSKPLLFQKLAERRNRL